MLPPDEERHRSLTGTAVQELKQPAEPMRCGIPVGPLADKETVVPGESLLVTVRVFAPSPDVTQTIAATVKAPAAWTVAPAPGGVGENSGSSFMRREVPAYASRYVVTVAPSAPPTQSPTQQPSETGSPATQSSTTEPAPESVAPELPIR